MDNIWENKKKILSGVKNLLIKNKIIEEIAEARQSICDDCEFKSKDCSPLIAECCSACGCSLKFKTRSLESSCPKDKWPSIDDK